MNVTCQKLGTDRCCTRMLYSHRCTRVRAFVTCYRFLALTKNMKSCRGQEHQLGQSELEEHNRVLTDRIGRLIADQKEADESLMKSEMHREALQEQLESLQADLKRTGLAQETCERVKADMIEQMRQAAQDLQLCTSQRDEKKRELEVQSEELSQVQLSLTSKHQELLETQEALQKEKELDFQARQTERKSFHAQIDELQLSVSEGLRQLTKSEEKCKHFESQLEAAVQETKLAQAQVLTFGNELSTTRMEVVVARKACLYA